MTRVCLRHLLRLFIEDTRWLHELLRLSHLTFRDVHSNKVQVSSTNQTQVLIDTIFARMLSLPSPLHLDHNLSAIRLSRECSLRRGFPCFACHDYLDLPPADHEDSRNQSERLEQRRLLRTKINQSHDPITQRFPVEIIGLIFQFSLLEKGSLGALDHLDTTISAVTRAAKRQFSSGPLLLGAVCRSWRHIAWTTPEIWTTIRLLLGRRHGEYKRRLEIAQEWLDRAGPELLLSIVVSWPFHEEANLRRWDTDDALIALVNNYSSRWTDVEIQGPSWVLALLSGNFEGAPNLNSLTIYPRHGQNFRFKLLAGKVRPTNVSIRWGSFRWLNIDWRWTTDVSAEFSIDECFQLLQCAPRLKKCRFSIGKDSGSFTLPDQPIVHEALESLEFLPSPKNNGNDVSRFLSGFSFPLLSDLKFGQRLELSWDLVIAFLKRSSCQVISLEIQAPCDYDVLLGVLLNTPSLRHLRTTDAHHQLFILLESTSEWSAGELAGPFLPNLESINIWPYRDSLDELFWIPLLGIFGTTPTRRPGSSQRPLNQLEVNRFWHPSQGIYSIGINTRVAGRISRLANEGVVVKVKDWNNKYDLLEVATGRQDSRMRVGAY